ncbi:MAG TPA: FHA domain-containing protein, partial [Thermoanaerobaculia bacterium]|nr:FHA domain-containing protein [Thermoanaerobaculia bacterium]
ITDKGSITGTYVNGKPVESARLSKGDAIEIGDLRLEIQIADPAKPLFLRVVPTRATIAFADEDDEAAAPVAAGARVVKAKKIDYADAYRLKRPWLTKAGLTAFIAIVVLTTIGDFLIRPERQTMFMPGGVSSAHSRAVASNCQKCHTPFKGVSNRKCIDCHPQDAHARFEQNPPECVTCHAEHRGQAKLAAMPDTRCVGCHTDLGAHARVGRTELASLKFAQDRYTFDDIARIAVFGETSHPEFAYPRDINTLRFNHKLHLADKGIFNAKGQREVLQCTGCHELVETRGMVDPVAIDFEQQCQRCHLLTFSPRYPNAQVPHGGDPGNLYGFIPTYFGDPTIATRSPDEIRRILSTRRQIAPGAKAIIETEQVIKTKCQKCHDVQRRANRLAVDPPVIRTSWLTHARFTHTSHRATPCETCHGTARQSVATSDALMPTRANCTGCHAADAKVARAGSQCVLCHEYHLGPKKPINPTSVQAGMGGLGSGGRMLQGILLAVIVILLLVVLVPVGIALFQRLKPERSAGAPAARVREVPASKVARPDGPTDKVAKQPPPPDIAPPRPEQPSVGATVMAPISQMTQVEPASAGTEMVQWYGMLHCTAGPLEGQRFVVDEEGFWIGRDPVLSKVVVPDGKVSKRHVRILPRDGKVWAVDEGSTNGTFLASAPGQRITEVQLKKGDTLVLGDNAATFTYQI